MAEALANITRHSRATRAGDLRVEHRAGHLVVNVSDDGIGGANRRRGTGLTGIRRRVAALGRDGRAEQPDRRADRAAGGVAVRVVIAEDNVLLREGLPAARDRRASRWWPRSTTPHAMIAASLEHRPGRRHHGHPAAADVPRRGVARRARPRAAQTPGCRCCCCPSTSSAPYATELLVDGAGGVGYLLKDRVAGVEEFLDALRRVAAGGTALDPQVVAQLVTARRNPLTVSPRGNARCSR